MIVVQDDGSLLVPVRVEGDDATGDAVRVVRRGDPDYEEWARFAARGDDDGPA